MELSPKAAPGAGEVITKEGAITLTVHSLVTD